MTAHDPMCPVRTMAPNEGHCYCALIARVRADERERHHDGGDCECTSVYADGTWVHAQRLTDLRAKVEGLPSATIVAGVWHGDPPHESDWDRPVVFLADVLALLKEKP